jgi:hypothetical protein
MKSVLGMSAALLPGIIAAALLGASARADVVTDWNVTTGTLVSSDVGNNPRLRGQSGYRDRSRSPISATFD